ncbi:hypothetical protein RND71_001704 [Anisodus tanguticus]|uniref:Uncharacterized protein n=1 Tax=Anisodus tanguticus TaxID=243964 RepID=A0AAE1T1E5_9SOLA|nr:hypothetical protein RND71_001704 [Anisodus tanguticus]
MCASKVGVITCRLRSNLSNYLYIMPKKKVSNIILRARFQQQTKDSGSVH